MRIRQQAIGPDEPPYIIAELGVNHEGDESLAFDLIEAAAEAQADAVKLQFFRASMLMSERSRLTAYQRKAGECDPFEMLRRLELTPEQLARIVNRAHDAGLHAIVTVFSEPLVDEAQRLGFDAYKTASPDIINKPLIDALLATGEPLILSTGASTMAEVRRAAAWAQRENVAMLHCVSAYPTPDDAAALGGIRTIALSTGLPVGYSDHTSSLETGALAIAAGACILEKHLTHSRSAAGPDHASSLEPSAFREYVRLARRTSSMVGSASKHPLDLERDVRSASRQSIVASCAIKAGRVIEPSDIAIKRPGDGVEPWRLDEVVGATLSRDVEPDEPLRDDILLPKPAAARTTRATRILIVTGARSEFGLLEPVMRSVAAHGDLKLLVAVTGEHLLAPAQTWREVAECFTIDERIIMQLDGDTGSRADAHALGRGVAGFAAAYEKLDPDWVLVLGDRVEALAAASAASVGGVPVAHLHGGDRAQGVADEAIRHAITKLAHLHLPATESSAQRILTMGESPSRVHVVGSPAIDALAGVAPMNDEEARELGDPDSIFLMHPVGDAFDTERRRAEQAMLAIADRRVLALAPNHDPGREGIVEAISASSATSLDHLPRRRFIALLKRLAQHRGLLIGNSSAALIEAAAIGLGAVDIGDRQTGRERCANVIHAAGDTAEAVRYAVETAAALDLTNISHPYGDGHAGERVADLLATMGPLTDHARRRLLRKRNVY